MAVIQKKKVRFHRRGALVFCALLCALPGLGQTWMRTSAPSNSWSAVACSADGSRIIASSSANGDRLLYGSTNSAATWSMMSAPAQFWASAAASAEGTTLFAAVGYDYLGGALWKSADAGLTWARTAAPQTNAWSSVACSANGNKIVGAVPGGAHYPAWLFSSTNGGSAWAAADMGLKLFSAVAGSADGTKWISAGDYGLFVSSDSGQSWSPASPGPSGDWWTAVASSADGSKLIGANAGNLVVSTNAGVSWMTTTAPSAAWVSVASSADGTRLVAAASNLPVYRSTDAGLTWQPTTTPATNWQAIASSADGARITAVVNGGGIYTSQSTPAIDLDIARSSGSLLLSWIVPSMKFDLEESPDLATWSPVPVLPSLNYLNLHYEVSLPVPASPRFYRLAAEP